MNASAAPVPTSSTRRSRSPVLAPAMALWHRDMVRFWRQRSRVLSSVLSPLLFWVLLGSGLSGIYVPGTDAEAGPVDYQQYFLPGAVVLSLLFTAIFSTISVIEDRREGFLQGVLASPSSRLAIVLGKVLGGATLATVQGAALLLLWIFVGDSVSAVAMIEAVGVMVLLALGLSALGLCVAWPMESTAGFHAIMMLLLWPMWFLSGAVFPVSAEIVWLRWVMILNPLSYGQAALMRRVSEGELDSALPVATPVALAIVAAGVIGLLAMATALVGRAPKK